MVKKFWKILLALALLLLLGGWLLFRWAGPPQIMVVRPTFGPAVQAVYATGTVEAGVMMPIAPRVAAQLKELLVDEGSHVEKDQVLARLDDEDVRQAMRELQARETFAREERDRNKALVGKGLVPKQEYERARSNWQAAQAAVAKTAAMLDYMKLAAPADGFVIRRDGEIGQLIPANQPVFWLSCCAPLRVSAEVDEEDIALVQPGQKAMIRADAFVGKVYRGTVQGITPKGDPVARSYRVRIAFDEPVPLLIGMTAEANIVIHEKPRALLLPASAVVDGQAWVVKNGKLERRKIEVGVQGDERTEVVGGITPDDTVVLQPNAELEAGQHVRVKFAEPSAQ